jgi:hypothetical protein
VFNEMGCLAETGVTKDLPRGKVEFDVIVDDNIPCTYANVSIGQGVFPKLLSMASEPPLSRSAQTVDLLFPARASSPARERRPKWTNVDLLTWEKFEALMFDRWVDGVTRKLNPLFAHAHRLNDPNDEHLWDGYECTEEAFNLLWALGQEYSLISLWALFIWLVPRGLHPVVAVGVTNHTSSTPIALDTYRKVVNAAPRICASAVDELTRFWGTVTRKQGR